MGPRPQTQDKKRGNETQKIKDNTTVIPETEREIQWKVDRELANHSLSSTASQGTSNIPFPWFLMLGCNSQAQDLQAHYLLHLPHYLVPTFPVSWEEEEKCLWKIAGLKLEKRKSSVSYGHKSLRTLKTNFC